MRFIDNQRPKGRATCRPIYAFAERAGHRLGGREAQALDISFNCGADRLVACAMASKVGERPCVRTAATSLVVESQRYRRHNDDSRSAQTARRVGSETDLVDRSEYGAFAFAGGKVDDENRACRHCEGRSNGGPLTCTSIGGPAQRLEKWVTWDIVGGEESSTL
jgi:hypothetical protein